MKTLKSVWLVALGFVLVLSSCKKNTQELFENSNQGNSIEALSLPNLPVLNTVTFCGEKVVPLCAGQYINIGTVTVRSATDGNVYITYKTTGSWFLRQLHLYAGPLADLPVNGAGNPVPGRFPYTKRFTAPLYSQEYTFVIPNLPQNFIIAAHADAVKLNLLGLGVAQQETAWGDGCSGTEINPGGQWGTYFEYTQTNCYMLPEICSMAINYFFDSTINGINIPWVDMNGVLPGNVTVGGFNYSEDEGRAIFEAPASSGYGYNYDARKAFTSVATLKLSGTNYLQEPVLTAAVVTCESWLLLCGKLSPNYLPICNPLVTAASQQIDQWINQNTCPDRR